MPVVAVVDNKRKSQRRVRAAKAVVVVVLLLCCMAVRHACGVDERKEQKSDLVNPNRSATAQRQQPWPQAVSTGLVATKHSVIKSLYCCSTTLCVDVSDAEEVSSRCAEQPGFRRNTHVQLITTTFCDHRNPLGGGAICIFYFFYVSMVCLLCVLACDTEVARVRMDGL